MSKEPKRNVYVGHRYVPKLMGEWEKKETYEGLSIVTHKGASYTSKKRVPVGIDISDEEYWVLTGNYNAQIEEYREDVRRFDGRITDNTSLIHSNKEDVDQKITGIENDIETEVLNLNNSLDEKASKNDLETTNKNIEEELLTIDNKKVTKVKGLIQASDYSQPDDMSDSDFIQSLFDKIDNDSKEGTVLLEGKNYILDKSLELDEYQILEGVGRSTQLIMKNGTQPIIEIKKSSDPEQYNYGVQIRDISITGSNENTGIKLNKATHIKIENVYIYETKIGIEGEDVWLADYTRVTVRNYNKFGEYGYKIGTGTSNVFTSTWAQRVDKGYDLGNLKYTTLNSAACDRFTEFAYWGGIGTTFNSCGAEKGRLVNGGFVFGQRARNSIYNGCVTMGITTDEPAGETSIFNFNGSQAIINNYRNNGSTDPIGIDFIHLQNYALVKESGSKITNHNGYCKFLGDKHGSILNYSRGKITLIIDEEEKIVFDAIDG